VGRERSIYVAEAPATRARAPSSLLPYNFGTGDEVGGGGGFRGLRHGDTAVLHTDRQPRFQKQVVFDVSKPVAM
jgi:hypothetical protein